MNWARWHVPGYECSSKGDTRFSALYAKLQDGRTIEEAYQLDVKGYRAVTDRWLEGKGKQPLNRKTRAELFAEYLELWRTWAIENPALIEDLEERSKGMTLTDRFATSDVNQAHALAVILTERAALRNLPFIF